MKRAVPKQPLVLTTFVIFCVVAAGESKQKLDNDDLWGKTSKKSVPKANAKNSPSICEETPISDNFGQAFNGHISDHYYNSKPIDAVSMLLGDDQEELLTFHGSPAAKVNLVSADGTDSRWWEFFDDQTTAEPISTEENNNDDAICGSGPDWLEAPNEPSRLDKEIVSILLPHTVHLTNTKEQQTFYERVKQIKQLAMPAALYSDQRQQDRTTNVLPPNLIRTRRANPESLLAPKDGQRSLVIVFDSTGSMGSELKQLRGAALNIIDEITKKDDNPIFNYIFVPFNDPVVGPRVVTRNKNELKNALEKLTVYGGDDCPEAALGGIYSALDAALPHSFVYVFTDATAKDMGLEKDVMQLIQKKQPVITFLVTGYCNEKQSERFQVFNKIAAASNGQVFDLSREQVEKVLLALPNILDINHVPMISIDSPKAGEHNIDLDVDSTLELLSISVAGGKPTIEIFDPTHALYDRAHDVINLTTVHVVNVIDPVPGKWNIKAASNSAHSVRLAGNSAVQFKFGFSLLEPQGAMSLSQRPILDASNYFAIDPSDPTLIRSLEWVTIRTKNVDTSGGPLFESTLPLQLVPGTKALYRTEAFVTPSQQFRIMINGTGAKGEPLYRLLSTAVQAVAHAPPEVSVGYIRELDLMEWDTLLLDCRIQSPFPFTASWLLNGTEILQKHFNQSNVLSIRIANVLHKDAGIYTCTAKTKKGTDEQKVIVRVTTNNKPIIRLFPGHTPAFLHDPLVALRCIVDRTDKEWLLHWTHNGKPLEMATGKSQLDFENIEPHHAGNYTCYVDVDGQRLSSENSTIIVQYAPKTPVSNVTLMKEYGMPVEIQCQIDAFPAPEYQWFYQSLDQTKELETYAAVSNMTQFTMAPEKEGLYVCEGTNNFGSVKQEFVLKGEANVAPLIIKPPETTVYVEPGSSITLNCSCELCQPLSKYIWNRQRGTFESSPVETIDNIRVSHDNDPSRNAVRYLLTIDDFQTHNVANYTCNLANKHGADTMIQHLRMMVPAEVETMLLDGETAIPPGGKIAISEGSVSSISCKVVGVPEPTLQWKFNGKPIVASDGYFKFENGNQTVSFRDSFTKAEQGTYECVVSNSFGSSRSSSLELILGVISTATTPRNVTAKVGEKITLNCSINGAPEPTVRWEPANSFENPTLKQQILDVSYTNAGSYRCIGKNMFGTAEQVIIVETFGAPEVEGALNVSLRLAKGQDTLLECFGLGIPEPSIRWTFNGAPIGRGSSLEITEKGLKLYKSSYEQSGMYGCVVENEHGVREKLHYVTVTDPPKITSSLTSLVTLLPNETVRFECSGTGSPPPNAVWLFNGTTVHHDRQLYLSYNNASFGTYTCLLENSEGTDRQNMLVNALRPPQRITGLSFTNSLEPLKVRVNDSLTLVCPFENYNSILWQLNETAVNMRHVRLQDNLLVIERLHSRHEGTYTCVVRNRAGSVQQSFAVVVQSPPTIHKIHPDELSDEFGELTKETKRRVKENPVDSSVEVQLLAGETLQLFCQASGLPKPTVYWNRVRVDQEQVVSRTANLTIPNVAVHHSANYTCVAENELAKSSQLYRLEVMTAPLSYDDSIESIEVFAGENVELNCEMQANPPASYKWLKEDFALDQCDHVLSFTNIQPQASGMYHCDVQNIFGHNKKSFKVLVEQYAEITSYSPNQTVVAGNNIELNCEAIGNPMPVFSIIRKGRVLASNAGLNFSVMVIGQNYSVKTSNPMYTFSAVRVSSFAGRFSMRKLKATLQDKGYYLCMVENEFGSKERLTTVDVMVPPYVQWSKLRSFGTIQEKEGNPLSLYCPIAGLPKPTIKWHRNAKPLKHSNRATFSISSLKKRDSGMYTCFGKNPAGMTELNFNLEVLVPPFLSDQELDSEEM